jgi:hypothetical protein
MTSRRKTILMASGVALLVSVLACGMGAGEPDLAPPPGEAPAAPRATALKPPAVGEPVEEPGPVPTIAERQPTLLPTATVSVGLSDGIPEVPQPAIPENRRLTLEYPAVMRLGDTTRIRLQLEIDELGNITPTALIEGNVVTGEIIQVPDLYETHNVIAEARLDLAGVQMQPAQAISEPLSKGKSVAFYWSVRPEESGNYQGSVWLHLVFISKETGEQSRIPISVQFIEIQVNTLFGRLSGSAARNVGAIGSAIGSVLGFPFVSDLLKWVWGKRKRKS